MTLKIIYIQNQTNSSRFLMFLNIHFLKPNIKSSITSCSEASNIHYFVSKHEKANFVKKYFSFPRD